MKTKIRIQTSTSNAFGVNYNHMAIDILTERYNGSKLQRDKLYHYLEPVGHITFQSNKDTPTDWYGMRFNVETNNANHIMMMAKLAKFVINKRSGYDAKPDEIIQLIGGEEYVFFDGEFISKKDNGKHIYNIVKPNSLIERIIVKNEKEGEKLLAKMNIADATLKFKKTINI